MIPQEIQTAIDQWISPDNMTVPEAIEALRSLIGDIEIQIEGLEIDLEND